MNLQEPVFKLDLHSPLIGQKTFQISPKESISDLRNTICETSQLLMYENFHFESGGKLLGQFQELGQILPNEARVNVIFDPYDERTSRFHFHKIKTILQNPSILSTHTSYNDEAIFSNQRESNTSVLPQNLSDFLQILTQEKFIQQDKNSNEQKFAECLTMSGYNPVPYFRRLMGDYYYLQFKSLEDDFHITACAAGFFINQSTNSHFNPNFSNKVTKTYTCLLDLLNAVSPKFKEQFKKALKKSKSKDFQRTQQGLLIGKRAQWLKNSPKQLNYSSSGKTYIQRNKRQEFLSIKDWNQMFQFQHLEPVQGYLDRVNRDKVKFKIYQEYIEHAKAGAVQIVERSVEPLNPHCSRQQETFLFANIYFSRLENSFEASELIQLIKDSTDTKSLQKKLSKKKTKQTNNFINNLQILDNFNRLQFNLSHSVLVQYRGQRFRASSFPSSLIHSKERRETIEKVISQKNLVNYKGNQILGHSKYQDFQKSLIRLTQKLNIVSDHVVRDLDTLKLRKITVNNNLKGLQTSDRRKYLFNLECLSPKDFNFLSRTDPYCVFRPELLALYNQKHKCKIPINTMLGQQVQGFQLHVNDRTYRQQKKLCQVGAFATGPIIKTVLHILDTELKLHLADTSSVVGVLHKHGLNCRYLGILLQKADNFKMPQVKIILQKVIYVKCLKNILNGAIKNAPPNLCNKIISRILNSVFFPCFEQENTCIREEQEIQLEQPKKKKKKYKQKEKESSLICILNQQNSAEFFLNIKSSDLQRAITKIAKLKYNHQFRLGNNLTKDQLNKTLTQYQPIQPRIFNMKFGKWAVLRDICLNIGLTLEKRNYFQTDQSNPGLSKTNIFKPEDILYFCPKATHISLEKPEVSRLIAQGDRFLSHFQIEQAIQYYNKAIHYLLTTYGGHNQKLPLLHKKLSFIYFKIGDIQTALLFGTHALEMFIDFYGIQHIETLDNIALIGFYLCADRKFKQAEQYLFKAIYYSSFTYSYAYPQLLNLWLNLSTLYEVQKKYPQAVMALGQGLRTCRKVYGQKHLNTAIYYTALASIHLQMPDIMQAVKFKEKAVNILKAVLSVNDGRLKESIQMLDYYKTLQNSKKIKEVHDKEQKKMSNQFTQYSQMMNLNNKNMRGFGKMQEYLARQNQQFWKKGGKKNKVFF